jgi:hypothetical protein
LAPELAFGPDLARDAGHFRREAVELIDHRIDGFLQFEDLAFSVGGDLAREIAACDRRGHRRDVADLFVRLVAIAFKLQKQFDLSRCVMPGPLRTLPFPWRPTALVPVRLDHS